MEAPISTLLERLRQATSPGLEVDRELGSGAMGVVFLGRDSVLDRPVAIKVLRPEIATGILANVFSARPGFSPSSTTPASFGFTRPARPAGSSIS